MSSSSRSLVLLVSRRFCFLHGQFHWRLVFSLPLGQGVLFLPNKFRWRFCSPIPYGLRSLCFFSCFFLFRTKRPSCFNNCVSGGSLAVLQQFVSLWARSVIFYWVHHDTRFQVVFTVINQSDRLKPVVLQLVLAGAWSARVGALFLWLGACGSHHISHAIAGGGWLLAVVLCCLGSLRGRRVLCTRHLSRQ